MNKKSLSTTSITANSTSKPRRGPLWRSRTSQDRLVFGLFLVPAFALMLVFTLYPILSIIYLSFNDMRLAIDEPKFGGFENFAWVFSNPYFGKALINTTIFTVFSLIFQTGLGLLIATLLNQDKLPGRGLFRTILLFAWLIPELIVAVIMRLIFGSNIGVLNLVLKNLGLTEQAWLNDSALALFTIIVVNIWKGLPFQILIYLTALQGINKEYYEAAEIDGANAWQKFWSITLPYLKPTMETMIILGTIWTSGVFFIPYILTKGGPNFSSLLWSQAIYDTIFSNQQLSRGAAMSVIITILLITLGSIYYFVFRKRENYEG